VLYEISTGKDRKDFPEPATGLGEQTDQALDELNAVILKACASDPEQRYQSAEEFHADLALLQSGKSVKSKRMLERRLALLTKSSVAGVMLSAVVIAGYFYQQHQTRASRRLTAQLQINNGIRLLDEVDMQGSLLWFAEALDKKESFLSAGERTQDRFRFDAVLQQCPRLTQIIVPDIADGKMADYGGLAEFSPDGRQILISGYGRTVLICDAATGKIFQRLEHHANVGRARFNRDGRRVITWLQNTQADVAGEGQVWNASTGQRVGRELLAVHHQFPHPPVALNAVYVTRRGGKPFDPEIAELDGHGVVGVELQRQYARLRRLGFLLAVERDGDAPLSGDAVQTPMTGLGVGGELSLSCIIGNPLSAWTFVIFPAIPI
jgi:hypothetical protein